MDKNLNPKVSVLLPVYNAEKYLSEAIDSILAQTFTDFEFLIINDGSTDKSDEIIKIYDDPRIRYISHTTNRGLVAVLNEGLHLATGKYIARMDADDISLPERLEIQVRYMDGNPDVGASGTAYQLFGGKNNLHVAPSGYQKAFTHLSFNSAIGHPCSIIRTDLIRPYNIQYEADYGYAADYVFWIRISLVSHITSVEQVLLRYRWHNGNMSSNDPSVFTSKTSARILWYESVLKKPITDEQKKYLEGNPKTREDFEAGRILFHEILELTDCGHLDKVYFGKINVTNWEVNLINQFGLKGLITCLFGSSLRKWSGATTLGLLSQYYKRKR